MTLPVRTAAFVLLLMAAMRAEAQHTTLTIRVTDMSGMFEDSLRPALFIGCSARGWDPAGIESVSSDGNGAAQWVFEIPRAEARRGYEFKFTRGDWSTVEVASDGSDVPNRRLPPIDWDAAEAPVVVLDVLGFADQRGTRWPARAERESTVTGTLDIFSFSCDALGERTIRVWTPPGYGEPENGNATYPVLYMHDAQNLFDERTSFGGSEWGADEVATELIELGKIEPIIIVGIDHAGAGRTREYLPFDAGELAPWARGGGADSYLDSFVHDVMPEINRRYRTRIDRASTAIGGSSLGGVVSLYAVLRHGEVFGRALVESPSLWVGDGELLRMLERHEGAWPERMFIAVGTDEAGAGDGSHRLVGLAEQTETLLRSRGLGKDRLMVVIGEGDKHNESAWRRRLPPALQLLFPHEADPP